MRKRIAALFAALILTLSMIGTSTLEAQAAPAVGCTSRVFNGNLHPFVEAHCFNLKSGTSWNFRVEATCWGGAKVYGAWARPSGYSRATCFLVNVVSHRIFVRG